MRTKEQVRENLNAIKANYQEVFHEPLHDDKIIAAVKDQLAKLKEKYLVDHRIKLYTDVECFMALEVLGAPAYVEPREEPRTSARGTAPHVERPSGDGEPESSEPKPTRRAGRPRKVLPRKGSQRVVVGSQADEDDGFEPFPQD